MPMYLVRWPGLVAALVTAANEDDLIDILDETGNPEGCTWSLYRGPVYIEFSLNAKVEIAESDKPLERPLEPSEVGLGDIAHPRTRRHERIHPRGRESHENGRRDHEEGIPGSSWCLESVPRCSSRG
jgi:hypothetical protein